MTTNIITDIMKISIRINVLREGKKYCFFFFSRDRVEIDTILSLSNSSSAEGQESILNLFLPTYVSFVRAVVTSPLKEILSVYNVDNSVTLYVSLRTPAHCTMPVMINEGYDYSVTNAMITVFGWGRVFQMGLFERFARVYPT